MDFPGLDRHLKGPSTFYGRWEVGLTPGTAFGPLSTSPEFRARGTPAYQLVCPPPMTKHNHDKKILFRAQKDLFTSIN